MTLHPDNRTNPRFDEDGDWYGRKVIMERDGVEVVATIRRISMTTPRTAYSVSWDAVDNPHADFVFEGVEEIGFDSVAHFSQILRLADSQSCAMPIDNS